ncbi:hypothetical protein IWQ60_006822 [Tieghemiomyces parasiticus]|uniref:Histidine kinase n=1 Tax=Tieghemiomyces parasiticus TaxID=78921 RepID=A0A9W8AB89_9FUNG|nr:hypothetical protein IWQ60_006822 [Tieghemiomyces parasiticus]
MSVAPHAGSPPSPGEARALRRAPTTPDQADDVCNQTQPGMLSMPSSITGTTTMSLTPAYSISNKQINRPYSPTKGAPTIAELTSAGPTGLFLAPSRAEEQPPVPEINWSNQFFNRTDVHARYPQLGDSGAPLIPPARHSSTPTAFPSPLATHSGPSTPPANAPAARWTSSPRSWLRALRTYYLASWSAFCQHVLPGLIVLLGIGISIVVFYVFVNSRRNGIINDFHWRSRERADTVINNFLTAQQASQGYYALVNSGAYVTNDLSNRYGQSALYNSNLFGLGINVVVPGSARTTFEQSRNLTLSQFDDNLDTFVPRANANEYCVLVMTYPEAGITPVGFDIFSDPIRTQAVKQARSTLAPALTGPMTIYQTVNGVLVPVPDPVVSVFYPVYGNITATGRPATPSDVVTIVGASYRLRTSFDQVLASFQDQPVLLQIWDVPTHQMLYHSDHLFNGTEWSDTTFDQKFTVLDRQWLVRSTVAKSALSKSVDATAIVLMTIMLFFAAVLAVILRMFTRRFFRARRTVHDQHVELGKSRFIGNLFSQQSEATLQAIADPLLALDCRGYVIGTNPHALDLTGYTRRELLGQSRRVAGRPPGRTHIRDLLVSLAECAFDEPCSFHHGAQPVRWGMRNVWVARKDGSRFEAEANFSQVIGDSHPQCLQVVVFRDMTERKAAKEAILEAKKQAERASQSKGAFLAFLCHEIRNPAHVILGYAEMLRSALGPQTREVQEDLLCIETAAQFMGVVVSDVLDLTHMTETSEGQVQLQQDTVQLPDFVRRCAKLQRGLADERGISLAIEVDDAVPPYFIFDRYRLSQVLIKLIIYTIEEGETGGAVEVSVHLVEWLDEANTRARLRFALTTTALVFSPAKLKSDDHLDKPFDLESNSLGAKFFSAGVSRVLALTIVKMLGGQLVVDTAPDGRSRCYFDLALDIPDSHQLHELELPFSASPTPSVSDLPYPVRPADLVGDPGSPPRPSFSGEQISLQSVSTTSRPSAAESEGEAYPLSVLSKASKYFRRHPPLGPAAGKESFQTSRSIDHPMSLSSGSSSSARDALGGLRQRRPTVDMSYDMALDHPVWRKPRSNPPQQLSPSGHFLPRRTALGKAPPPVLTDILQRLPSTQSSDSHCRTSPTMARPPLAEPLIALPQADLIPQEVAEPTAKSQEEKGTASATPLAGVEALRAVEDEGATAVATPHKSSRSLLKLRAQATTPSSTPPAPLPTDPDLSSGRRVLLVEDNLICQRVTAKMLKKNNFVVDIANHGREAVELILQHRSVAESDDAPSGPYDEYYACVLMDVIMPIMDGCEAASAIVELGYSGPIIALTANSIESERRRCLKSGMAAFVTKPVREKDLIALVRSEIRDWEGSEE